MARKPRYYHHGNSPAALTGSILAAIGFVIITIAIFASQWVIVGIGAALVVIAAIATLVMKAMGLGQP